MPEKLPDDKLKDLVKTPGWELDTGGKDNSIVGTLEELLHITHQRHKSGEKPGLIRQIGTAIELDLIQIEELWWGLGLPR
jgi:hypothetical protein